MTVKAEKNVFALLKAGNIKYEIQEDNIKIILRVKTSRKSKRLCFEQVKSKKNLNPSQDEIILNIQRDGKEITDPFLISSTENIEINKELLEKGFERILQHGDTIEYDQDIVIIYEEQRNLLTVEFPQNIRDKFYATKQFNNGLTETVFIVQSIREPKKKYVLKEIKNNLDGSIAREAELMIKLKHPNIVSLIEIFKYDFKSYLLIEFMEDIDLLVQITKSPKNHLTEYDAKLCFYQIVQGIKYMHDLNIAHADIKPENIFIREVNGILLCKLGDFGQSNYDDGSGESGGTLLYSAPENLIKKNKNYSSKRADMWSLGVLLYCMLSGKWPFYASSSMIRLLIAKGEFSFKADVWKTVSIEAKNLMSMLINVDPMLRFTADEVLKCKWFDDNQLLSDIKVMNTQITQDQAPLIPAGRVTRSKSKTAEKRKRKLPFSVPQFLNQKRRKA